jgi:predicted dehydrogenase
VSRVDGTHGCAIVGGGVIGPTHAAAIDALRNARLVAVVDEDAERARDLADPFGAEAATELDRVLDRSDVDVVTVCVPSGRHAEIGTRAAAAGKHVIVEKPLEVTLEAADRLIAAARSAGVRLGVISQHRFDPGVRRMKDLIESGRLGRLVLGDAYVKWYRTQQYYESGDWRGTWELDGGGCLMNQGVHYVDLLQWMMGPVERIFGRCRTADHDIDVEDVATALLSFQNGAVGVIEASTAVYPGMEERLEVTGTGGTLVVQSGALRVCELKDEGGEVPPYRRTLSEPEGGSGGSAAADPAAVGTDSHRAQLADFLDAIERDRAPAVSGEDARRPLEVILGVYESARTGREVTLPLA